MRFLVDENATGTVVRELRRRGHDVLSVKESMRSEPDILILARAQVEERIVLSHDKDFGELAFRSRLPASCGIILFRLNGAGPDADNRRVLEAIESREDWAGHFSVVSDDRIRMRPLPPVGGLPEGPTWGPKQEWRSLPGMVFVLPTTIQCRQGARPMPSHNLFDRRSMPIIRETSCMGCDRR